MPTTLYDKPSVARFGTFRQLTRDYYCQNSFAQSGHAAIPRGCETVVCHDFGVCNVLGGGSMVL